MQSSDLRSEVQAYLTATLRGLDCEPLRVGGVGDHVHILATLSKSISIAELVKNLKTGSTKIMKNKGNVHFAWQTGYGAFSVSQSSKESVISYIATQEEHHRKMTFQEELRFLLQKHGITFDERHLWDSFL
jgi:REP element-mobilizing transposase RayT